MPIFSWDGSALGWGVRRFHNNIDKVFVFQPNIIWRMANALLLISRSRVPNGIRYGRGSGKVRRCWPIAMEMWSIEHPCSPVSTLQHKSTITGCGLYLRVAVHRLLIVAVEKVGVSTAIRRRVSTRGWGTFCLDSLDAWRPCQVSVNRHVWPVSCNSPSFDKENLKYWTSWPSVGTASLQNRSPTRFLSKIDRKLFEEWGTFLNIPGRRGLLQSWKIPFCFLDPFCRTEFGAVLFSFFVGL